MKNKEALQIIKNKEGKRIFIRRFPDNLLSIKQYREDAKKEVKQGKDYPHSNIIEYVGISADEDGDYIEFKFIMSSPLSQAILDSAYSINNKKDSFRIANQLFDAVSYLNQHKIFHLNLTPDTIYITRNSHEVKLTSPLNTYIDRNLSFAIFDSKFSAPELKNENSSTYDKCDIYSLGKILEFLFSYSNLSMTLRRIIKKATNPDPSKRYGSVAEMKKEFNKIKLYNFAIIALQIASITALLIFIYTTIRMSDSNTEGYRFYEETKRRHYINKNDKNEEHRISNTVMSTLSMDSLKSEREKMHSIAESIFIKEFTKRAEKIISDIYTPKVMNSSQDTFKKLSLDGFTQLDILQKELAKTYNLDIVLTTKLSAEIINKLTKESMNKLKTEKRQD